MTCLARKEGQYILNLLCSVGKAFPQAVYFPIRTLYLTLKMEQKEKCKGRERKREGEEGRGRKGERGKNGDWEQGRKGGRRAT